MLPAPDTTIAPDGLALVIGQYKKDPNLNGLLEAVLESVQETEGALWDGINSQLLTRTFEAGTGQGELSGPPDQALLQVADLVGCPVGSFTTAQLAFLIPIWILARKSKARMIDILNLCAEAFANGFTYGEFYPWAFQVTVPNVADDSLIAPLAQALTLARPPATAAAVAWGTWPTETFYFGDGSPGGALGSGFDDAGAPSSYPAGLLSAVKV